MRKNLEKVIELRNTSTHFITEEYEAVYVSLLQACVFNFVDKMLYLINISGEYCAADIYDNDPMVEELVDFIISKDLMRIGDPVNLGRLYKEIVEKDWFMALLDVKDYIQTKEQMLKDYEDKNAWAKKMLVNIAKAGFFSSDRTIAEDNQDIWHL